MPLWFAGFLGLVQGLTEFLPVSSTAHLRVASTLTGQPDAGAAYTAVIQLGTLAAVLAYFWRDLLSFPVVMIRAPLGADARLPWLILLGSIPIVVCGLLFRKQIETDLRSLYVIAIALIVVGIAMGVIDRTTSGDRILASLRWSDALVVGGAQALALVPGVSRSGATLCALLLLGFARPEAARFSFLLSIPAIAGAGILQARSAWSSLGTQAIPALAVGIVIAGIVGYASIAWFIKWLGAHSMIGFAVYRVAAGGALLAALASGYLRAR